MMISTNGTALGALPDGSVLAGGPLPTFDTYAIDAPSEQSSITALRVEALTDSSLPGEGPGRQPDVLRRGVFCLTQIRLSTVDGQSAPRSVGLTRARVDYSYAELPFRAFRGTRRAEKNSAWYIWPAVGQPHQAVFQTARPIKPTAGMTLRVELTSGLEAEPYSTLGRFRLSVTDQPFPLHRTSLQAIRTDTERNGVTRLGATYVLLDEWASAAALLAQAVTRPGASALDGFLLALAPITRTGTTRRNVNAIAR